MSTYTVQRSNGQDAYKMEPRGKGSTLCYELYYWRDAYTEDNGTEHAGLWKSMGKFPSTVSHGLRLIAEDIERNGGYKFFAKAAPQSLRQAAEEWNGILEGFKLKVSE